MPISNDEIRNRFTLDGRGVIRWKRIELPNELAWLERVVAPLNKEAGDEVRFLTHQRGGRFVRIAGCDVYEHRIRELLSRDDGREVPKRARKARGGARSAPRGDVKGEMRTCRMPDGSLIEAGPFADLMDYIRWSQETGGKDIRHE